MTKTNLLPCPFCGGESNGQTTVNVTETARSGPRFGVHCYFCGARVEFFETMDEAIAAWNTRAERTCELDGTISFDWQATTTTFYTHSLSCGHNVTATEPKPPNYCEECGAKVVER